MATKKNVSAAVAEDVHAPVAPVVFGEGGGSESNQGGDQGNSSAGKKVRNGKKVGKGEGGPVQAANLQTVTTVGAFKDEKGELQKDTLPQEDDDKMANRYLQRFLQNGDICEGEGENKKSLYAKRMVNEGKQFQHSKAVVNPFPKTGAAYVELLKQQGQFNRKPEEQPKPQDQPNGGSQNSSNGGSTGSEV